MEIKTSTPFIALLAAIVAIGILAITSLVVVIPLFLLLKQADLISGKEKFIILWIIITFLRSLIPTRKNNSIVINL